MSFIFLQVVLMHSLADENKFVPYKTTDGLSFNNVDHLAEDDEGYIYASTRQGLNVFNGTSFTIFDQSNTPGFSNKVSMVLPLEKGYLLIGTSDRGLFVYDKFKEKVVAIRSSFKGQEISPSISTLEKDREGFLWAGTSKGELYCVSTENLTLSLKNNQ